MTTSESLLRRLADHRDSAAWNRLVELYTPLIFYWARRAGLQPADASDLVQDVLSIVSRRIGEFTYDRTKSFRGWLRKVTLNQFRLHCRRRQGREQLERDSKLVQYPDDRSLEASWDQAYRVELVQRAIATLQPDFAEKTWNALSELLRTYEPAEVIAKRHGISVWTLYSAKCRLIKRVREQLYGLLD